MSPKCLIDLVRPDEVLGNRYRRYEEIDSLGSDLISCDMVRDRTDATVPTSVHQTQEALSRNLSTHPVYARKVENTPQGWSDGITWWDHFEQGTDEAGSLTSGAVFVTVVTLQTNRSGATIDLSSIAYYYLHVLWMNRNAREAGGTFVLLLDAPTMEATFEVDALLRYLLPWTGGQISVLLTYNRKDIVCLNRGSISRTPLRKVIPVLPIARKPMPSNDTPFHRTVIVLEDFQSETNALSELDLQAIERCRNVDELGFFEHVNTNALVNLRLVLAQLLDAVRRGRDVKDLEGETAHQNRNDSNRRIRAFQRILTVMRQNLLGVNLLAQLIYCDTVFYARRSGDLSDLGDDTLPGSTQHLLEKMAFDAVSYAECMCQTIENSCLHTSCGMAFALLTLHEIPRQSHMLSLERQLSALETRQQLENEYFLDRTKPGQQEGVVLPQTSVLEMRTLDYSERVVHLDTLTQKCLGIPRIYQVELTLRGGVRPDDKGPLPDNRRGIRWMFDRIARLVDVNSAINHYGLAMFAKVVLTNRGIFRIVTPGMMIKPPQVKTTKNVRRGLERGLEFYACGVDSQGCKQEYVEFKEGTGTWSEVGALVPVGLAWRDAAFRQSMQKVGDELYDPVYVGKGYVELLRTVKMSETGATVTEKSSAAIEQQPTSLSFGDEQHKEELVEVVARQLGEGLFNEVWGDGLAFGKLPLLDYAGEGLVSTEVFAKGLFKCLMEHRNTRETKDDRLLMALFFRQRALVYHFLRVFSVFYAKSGVAKNLLESVAPFQIYVCVDGGPKSCTGVPEVIFVLSCSESHQAEMTARIFCYHFAGSTKDVLPFVEYLSDGAASDGATSAKDEAELIAPIDLYLTATVRDGVLHKAVGEEPWFMRRLSGVVTGDVSQESLGCKCPNVHLHVGSRVHVNDFYDCTSIFQNVILVKTMAIFLATHILKDLVRECTNPSRVPSHIYLYGYEEISSLLVREVSRFLHAALVRNDLMHSIAVECALYLIEGNEVTNVYDSRPFVIDADAVSPKVVQIVPVGTTLSTLFRMRNALRRKLAKSIELELPNIHIGRTQEWDYAFEGTQMDAACGCLERLSSIDIDYLCAYVPILVIPDNETKSVNQYWRYHDTESHVVLAKGAHGDSLSVYYLTSAKTSWYSPTACGLCSVLNERYLASANAIGAAPKLHVGTALHDAHSSGRSADASFFGSIDYGHIVSGSNHIQCYVRPADYYDHVQDTDDFEQWLSDLREKVSIHNYNVIIAPMEGNESGFYSRILSSSFAHSFRFIHADLTYSTIDEICMRYRSAIEDIRDVGQYRNVSFYFLQHIISSGATLRKAETIVRMIRVRAGLSTSENDPVFRLIITLVDKSPAFTHAGGMGGGDEHGTLVAYRRLAVPAHGVRAESCPVCESVELLRGIANACARPNLALEFTRLAKRREGIGHDLYRKKLRERARGDADCLQWLLEWSEYAAFVFCDASGPHGRTIDPDYATRCGGALEVAQNARNKLGISQDEPMLTINDLDICEGGEGIGESWYEVFVHEVLGLHNYMRLICEDELGRTFGLGPASSASAVLSSFLEVIERRLNEANNPYSAKEWLVSYLKVASRGSLSQTIAVKQALLTTCSFLAARLTDCDVCEVVVSDDVTVDNQSIDALERIAAFALPDSKGGNQRLGNFSHEQRFVLHLLRTSLNRLAELRSSFLLDMHKLKAAYDSMSALAKGLCKSTLLRNRLAAKRLDETSLRLYFQRLIKECALSGPDDSKAFRAIDLAHQLVEDGSEGVYNWLAQAILLETSGVMLEGVSRLLEAWGTVPVRETLVSALHKETAGESPFINNAHAKLQAIHDMYDEILGHGPRINERELISYIDLNTHYLYKRCALKFVDIEWDGSVESSKALPHSRIRSLIKLLMLDVCEDNGVTVDIVKHDLASSLLILKYVSELSGQTSVAMAPPNRQLCYEGICNCVRDLLGSLECVLVQVRGGVGMVLSGSSYLASHIYGGVDGAGAFGNGATRAIDNDRLREVLPRMHFDGMMATSENVLALGLLHHGEIASQGVPDGLFALLLFKTEADANSVRHDVRRLRNVLFARHPLARVLTGDVALLIDDAADYGSVHRLTESETGARILHLSDLHIPDGMAEFAAIGKHVRESLVHNGSHGGRWEQGRWVGDKALFPHAYDLILITGDVVSGAKTSSGLERNYEHATDFILALAQFFWSDEEGSLRRDWQKRVAIITGNHDYAAMNDYVAMHVDRKRVNDLGTATRERGTAMSQFLYLSRFLHDTLGESISSLWLSGFNDVRNYDSLGLSVVLLNTSARVSSLRTNKVGLPEELRPKDLVDRIHECNRVIVMSHHSPCYAIDYASDEYFDCSMGERYSFTGKLDELKKTLRQYSPNRESESGAAIVLPILSFESKNLAEKWVQHSLVSWLLKIGRQDKATGAYKLPVSKVLKSEVWDDPEDACRRELEATKLWKEIKRASTLASVDGHGFGDEALCDLVRKIALNDELSKRDKNELQSFFRELFRTLRKRGREVICISGHVHIGSEVVLEGSDVRCVTVGRFLDCVFINKRGSRNTADGAFDWTFAGKAIANRTNARLEMRYAVRYSEIELSHERAEAEGEHDTAHDAMRKFEYEALGFLYGKNRCNTNTAPKGETLALGSSFEDVSRYSLRLYPDLGDKASDGIKGENRYATEGWRLPESEERDSGE